MVRYIVRRSLWVVVLMAVISVVTFGIFFLVPANPAAQSAGKNADAETIADVKRKLGLDKPIYVQYGNYVKGIFVGRQIGEVECKAPCLGYSFKNDQAVTDELKTRFPITFSLAIGASVLWLLWGVSVGVLSALKKGSIFDRTAMTVALAGVSTPSYFSGLILLYVFSYKLRWLPNIKYTAFTESPILWARGLILPWICLAFLHGALYARLTRANMLETMGEDYVRTARAKGLPERTVIRRHALRAGLTPLITIFGLDLGGLLGGAILTEQVFSLQGMGKLAITSIGNFDLPMVLGVTVLAALFIVIANLVVDVLYAVVDPRVRYS